MGKRIDEETFRAPPRFVLLPPGPSFGQKLISRSDLVKGIEGFSPVLFMGRLWALFGPAAPRDGGFEYAIRDRETGVDFMAYSGASGPSYGGLVTADRLLPSARALEKALARVAYADCSIEIELDVDYGGGRVRIGMRGGKPFQKEVGPSKKKQRPKTYDECLELAKAAGGPYGVDSGWQSCIEDALPREPSHFKLGRRKYENCVGFGIAKSGAPVLHYVVSDGLEEIAVEQIPWKKPLSATVRLWLESYGKWRRSQKPKRSAK